MLIYAPSSLSAPDTEGSTSDSIGLSQELAPSVTWKTKFLRPQSWLTILKKADWMTRLFGPISRRLTLARSGAELIQSWADTLASHSPLLDSGEGQKTQGICGHTSQESLTLFGPESASLKTSAVTFDWDCPKCLANSENLATELGRVYSQRRKSAPRTDGSESLSSDAWSTPRASPNENRTTKPPPSHGKTHGRCLAGDVQAMWPTAATRDFHAQGLSHNVASKSDSLATKVQRDWPTASARDYKDTPGMATEATNPDGSRRDRTDQLARAVYWTTPAASEAEGGEIKHLPGKTMKDRQRMRNYKLRDHVLEPEASHGQAAQENPSTNGKSREQSTENSIPPGSPS